MPHTRGRGCKASVHTSLTALLTALLCVLCKRSRSSLWPSSTKLSTAATSTPATAASRILLIVSVVFACSCSCALRCFRSPRWHSTKRSSLGGNRHKLKSSLPRTIPSSRSSRSSVPAGMLAMNMLDKHRGSTKACSDCRTGSGCAEAGPAASARLPGSAERGRRNLRIVRRFRTSTGAGWQVLDASAASSPNNLVHRGIAVPLRMVPALWNSTSSSLQYWACVLASSKAE